MSEPSASRIQDVLAALDRFLAESKSAGKSVTLNDCMREIPGLAEVSWQGIDEHLQLLPSPESSGHGLSGYQVLKSLGESHLGRCHEVEDAKGQRFLLRVLSSQPDVGKRELSLIQTEFQLLRTDGAQGLMTPLSCGLDKNLLYCLEELPPVENLKRLIRRIHLAESEGEALEGRQKALRTLAAAADQLAQAHDLGVIHGNLTPELIAETAAGLQIRGFGLRLLPPPVSPSESLDSLVYRAPEQLSWKHSREDRRSDIWALGAMAHEIVTGLAPIALATEAQLRREAARFVARSPKVEEIGLPQGLNFVINQALAPEPSRRYGDASDFSRDLLTALQGQRPLARAASLNDRFLRWMRREPGLAAAGFVIFALLGTAGIVSGWFVGVADRDALVLPLRKTIAGHQAREREAQENSKELSRDQELGAQLESLSSFMEVVRFSPLAALLLTDLLDGFLEAYKYRGIDLLSNADLDSVSAIFDGAYQRSSGDARRLVAGLYRLRVLIDDLNESANLEMDPSLKERSRVVDRNVTIFIERCEKDPSLRHLWRVARHGDPLAYDRLDPFLDPAHWRLQSAEYIAFLADSLAAYPERSDAARVLIAEALRFRSSSSLLQIRGGLIELAEAKRRKPVDVDGLRRSIVHLEVATALGAKAVASRLPLAEALALDGNFRDAILNLDEAINIAPKSALVWLLRAIFFKDHPLGSRAQDSAERALELMPRWRDLPQIMQRLESTH